LNVHICFKKFQFSILEKQQKKIHPVDDQSERTSQTEIHVLILFSSQEAEHSSWLMTQPLLCPWDAGGFMLSFVSHFYSTHSCLGRGPSEISSWLCFRLGNSNGSTLFNTSRAGGSKPK
jgi:hypothetical protein